ncbi:hypothetical protein IEO21_04952 [Rhodonia placenta]|uniref:Uncharacterized protein n=1 Tax=Rhodonia placenta TaxID=104341 RepID=A0A8H7P2R9_9APHY|nr:hypothetical protein IEO21_04952 [Postia placenta]
MCCYLSTYVEYSCSHRILQQKQYLDCNRWDCRLSKYHNHDNAEHDCRSNCAQDLLEDRHLTVDWQHRPCTPCRVMAPTNGVNA